MQLEERQMKLTDKELQAHYFGAHNFKKTEDGYIQAFQYCDDQVKYFEGAFDFWYPRSLASTAKTLEFVTEATELSFDYKFIWKGSEDSFELAVDGIIASIAYVKDLAEEGRIAFKVPDDLDHAGPKHLMIYLPADATVLVKDLEINAAASVPEKTAKVLWLGDSITQGFGPLRSSCTYVSVANRVLNWDIINQGIGGYVYDKLSLMPMPGYRPEKIIVALGTNQYGEKTMAPVEEYYQRLMEIYGNDIPVLCISPIWRGDHPEEFEVFNKYCENVKKVAGSYRNVTVVDGWKLVPHLPEYYLDNLHPNCHGAEVYARNLVEEIRRLGF